MRIKIIFVLFLTIVISFLSSGIGRQSYQNLTDHDRILLGISYYEVALKYKELGKDDLYNSYMSEALNIEKNVKKYATGEMEIPEKKININLDNVIPDENTDQNKDLSNDQSAQNKDASKDKINLNLSPEDIVYSLVTSIIDSDYQKAATHFSNEIWFSQYRYMIDQNQLMDIFKEWKNGNQNIRTYDEIIKEVNLIDKETYQSENFTLSDVSCISVEFKSNPIFPDNNFDGKFLLICQEFTNPDVFKIVAIDQI
jgi:hypothetical protein